MLRKIACAALLAVSATIAFTQDFLAKPITIVVPNPPGGLVDTSARLVGDPLAKVLKQSVVLDNRPSGSGNVADQAVGRAKPGGYTLLASYSAYHTGSPWLMKDLPWAPKDFAPVALMIVATNAITVHP